MWELEKGSCFHIKIKGDVLRHHERCLPDVARSLRLLTLIQCGGSVCYWHPGNSARTWRRLLGRQESWESSMAWSSPMLCLKKTLVFKWIKLQGARASPDRAPRACFRDVGFPARSLEAVMLSANQDLSSLRLPNIEVLEQEIILNVQSSCLILF